MKIIYWTTSCLEPLIEAVSREVCELSVRFKNSLVFAVSSHLVIKGSLSKRRIGLNSRFDPFLRAVIPFLEKRTDISHVYSEVSPWIFYKTLKSKPIVLTIASEKGSPVREFLKACRSIVVQTEGMRKRIIGYGMQENKVHLVYPGVDLSLFQRRGKVPGYERIKILLATVPRSEKELKERGVFFMMKAAKYCHEVDFRLIFRPWETGHSSLAVTRKLVEEVGTHNIEISEGLIKNLDEMYRAHHFTIIPYASAEGGKECPRSLIESLACGVPILISEIAPFAYFVSAHQCGVVFPLTVQGFASALERGLRDYSKLSENASVCAERYFDRKKTFATYESIYQSVI
jgi:glycosyltransferase involved in cell wall biosynthesis